MCNLKSNARLLLVELIQPIVNQDAFGRFRFLISIKMFREEKSEASFLQLWRSQSLMMTFGFMLQRITSPDSCFTSLRGSYWRSRSVQHLIERFQSVTTILLSLLFFFSSCGVFSSVCESCVRLWCLLRLTGFSSSFHMAWSDVENEPDEED